MPSRNPLHRHSFLACLTLATLGLLAIGAASSAVGDDNYAEDDARFRIVATAEERARTILLDTDTGDTWILRASGSQPVGFEWIKIPKQ